MEIWEPKPPGTLWATPGLLRECFTFFISNYFIPVCLNISQTDLRTYVWTVGISLICHNSVTQLKMCDFSVEAFKGFECYNFL